MSEMYRFLVTQTRAVTIEVEARDLDEARDVAQQELDRVDASDEHITPADEATTKLRVASSDWWIHE